MPDRAPSMCAFRQALESLETLHPSMMLEQPVHLLVSRVSQCRSTSAFTVRACKTIVQGRPLHRLGNGAYVSAAPLAFVHIAAQETSMIALLELCLLYTSPIIQAVQYPAYFKYGNLGIRQCLIQGKKRGGAMNDVQLRSFTAAVELGSFNKAAKGQFLSVPSFAQRINSLEAELGYRILERGPSGVRPTDAGLVLYRDRKSVV